MNMNGQPIGIFDSGIGGLSILQELYRRLPTENYVFFADQHNVPYGEKTKEELIALTTRIVKFLLDEQAKMVVVACNTATCYAIETLRTSYDIPIVGVVPAIKLAAEQTKTNEIALISTPATAKSDYVTDLIQKFAVGKTVARIGCFGLENAVETGKLDSKETAQVLAKYILPLKETNVDQLVLGCTHYPFLKKQISDILGPSVTLIDSGAAVARRVEAVLAEKNIANSSGASETKFFTNGDADRFSEVASSLLGRVIQGTYNAI
jgi:glutamate racemase